MELPKKIFIEDHPANLNKDRSPYVSLPHWKLIDDTFAIYGAKLIVTDLKVIRVGLLKPDDTWQIEGFSNFTPLYYWSF